MKAKSKAREDGLTLGRPFSKATTVERKKTPTQCVLKWLAVHNIYRTPWVLLWQVQHDVRTWNSIVRDLHASHAQVVVAKRTLTRAPYHRLKGAKNGTLGATRSRD